jgi:hypothetical protein
MHIGGNNMNCHGDNKEKQDAHKHSPMKHMLHMIICCGLPIVVVGLLPLISKVSPSASNAITKIVPFLCPIMMLAMLPMMFGGNKKSNCCDNKNADVNNK